MDAETGTMGQGRPVVACPRKRAGVEGTRSEAQGQGRAGAPRPARKQSHTDIDAPARANEPASRALRLNSANPGYPLRHIVHQRLGHFIQVNR